MLSTVGIPSSTLLKAVMAVIETSQKKGILSKLGLTLCGKFLTLFCAVQVNARLYPRKGDPKVWPFKWKVMNSTFLWYCLFICAKRFKCDLKWKQLSNFFLWLNYRFWLASWSENELVDIASFFNVLGNGLLGLFKFLRWSGCILLFIRSYIRWS